MEVAHVATEAFDGSREFLPLSHPPIADVRSSP